MFSYSKRMHQLEGHKMWDWEVVSMRWSSEVSYDHKIEIGKWL